MKKEVVLAVVLGLVVGLIITFGIYTANRALQQRREKQNTKQTETPPPAPEQQSSIRIFAPEDGTIVDTDTVRLSGTTLPNADIVIFLNTENEIVTTADTTGNFSVDLTVTGGSNVIETVVTNAQGQQERDVRTVVYSTANLEEPSPTATASGKLTKPSPSPKESL